ncbi:ATP-binding protein [Plantactinospora soyae]|uniref:histidine kinase n=1 Tax=Plantactinospora soyae TaxID=1544732 RepID=A0A927M2P1_9ACTN|nr:ATP-binding protein [Plantactinospora soyae]MBE1485720.1 signal transduction histidine kinase [Plantactinospora soyae]
MTAHDPPRRLRLTARARLTLLYAGLFALSGAALATVIMTLTFAPVEPGGTPTKVTELRKATTPPSGKPSVSVADLGRAQEQIRLKEAARRELRDRIVGSSVIAIGAMTLASAGLGWLMAGRVLRPVHLVSGTARRLSQRNLDQRIPVAGPRDEMRELAETFNSMLDRLETAFEAQRRFAANASHELRGPMTTSRTLVEVAAATPGASPDLALLAGQLKQVLSRQDRIVEGLLALAQSEHGTSTRQPVRLDLLARDALDRRAAELTERSISVRVELGAATVSGDPTLLELLVDNLVRNAVRHNHPDGVVWIRTDGSTIVVENTGDQVSAERLRELVEPFRRGRQDRVYGSGGAGLGLAIVDAVSRAHGGRFTLTPRPGGGVRALVTGPADSTS